MPEDRKPPEPPLGKRLLVGVKNHTGATISSFVAGLAVVVVGILVLGQGDSGGESATTSTAAQKVAKPESAVEKVAQRPYWIHEPHTFPSAGTGEGGTEPVVREFPLDLYVAPGPKAMFESPDLYEGGTIFVIGRVVSQQSVPGRFYDQEIRLVSGESGFDLFVGVGGGYGDAFVTDGEVAVVLGLLAAVGETEVPGQSPRRSAYMLALTRNGGEVESALLTDTTSGSLRAAIRRVTEETRPGGD